MERMFKRRAELSARRRAVATKGEAGVSLEAAAAESRAASRPSSHGGGRRGDEEGVVPSATAPARWGGSPLQRHEVAAAAAAAAATATAAAAPAAAASARAPAGAEKPAPAMARLFSAAADDPFRSITRPGRPRGLEEAGPLGGSASSAVALSSSRGPLASRPAWAAASSRSSFRQGAEEGSALLSPKSWVLRRVVERRRRPRRVEALEAGMRAAEREAARRCLGGLMGRLEKRERIALFRARLELPLPSPAARRVYAAMDARDALSVSRKDAVLSHASALADYERRAVERKQRIAAYDDASADLDGENARLVALARDKARWRKVKARLVAQVSAAEKALVDVEDDLADREMDRSHAAAAATEQQQHGKTREEGLERNFVDAARAVTDLMLRRNAATDLKRDLADELTTALGRIAAIEAEARDTEAARDRSLLSLAAATAALGGDIASKGPKKKKKKKKTTTPSSSSTESNIAEGAAAAAANIISEKWNNNNNNNKNKTSLRDAAHVVQVEAAAAQRWAKDGHELDRRRSRVRMAFFEALGDESFRGVAHGLVDGVTLHDLRALGCVSRAARAFARPEIRFAEGVVAVQAVSRSRKLAMRFKRHQRERDTARRIVEFFKWRLFKQRFHDRLVKKAACRAVDRDLGLTAAHAFGELLGLEVMGVPRGGSSQRDVALALGAALSHAPYDADAVSVMAPTLAYAAVRALLVVKDRPDTATTALTYLGLVRTVATDPRATVAILSNPHTSRVIDLALGRRAKNHEEKSALVRLAASTSRAMLTALFLDVRPVDGAVREEAVKRWTRGGSTLRGLAVELNSRRLDSLAQLAVLDTFHILLDEWAAGRDALLEAGATRALLKYLATAAVAYASRAETAADEHADMSAHLAAQMVWRLVDCPRGVEAAYAEDNVIVVATAALLACAAWPYVQKLGCVLFGVVCAADRPRATRMAPAVPLLENIAMNPANEPLQYAALAALEAACLHESDDDGDGGGGKKRVDATSIALARHLTTRGILDVIKQLPKPGDYAAGPTKDAGPKIPEFDADLICYCDQEDFHVPTPADTFHDDLGFPRNVVEEHAPPRVLQKQPPRREVK